VSSDRPLDVMIFDEDEYLSWVRTGKMDSSHGYYHGEAHGDHFHGFFTAPEDEEYLVVVCNRSRHEAEMQVDIAYAD
jgi:hypothetical protein